MQKQRLSRAAAFWFATSFFWPMCRLRTAQQKKKNSFAIEQHGRV
jgi:hypothetical protein